jgi:hypothetical protein
MKTNKQLFPWWAIALIFIGGFLILLFIALAAGGSEVQEWQRDFDLLELQLMRE